MLLLSGMAVFVGVISTLVAWALLWLINTITNLAFYQHFSGGAVNPQGHHLGWG